MRGRTQRAPAPQGPGAGSLLRQAEAHRDAGRLAEAARLYRRVLDRQPGEAAAHHGLGLVASRTDGPETAVPLFAAALRADPDRPHYWLSLATALLAAERVVEARAILERFVARGFTGPDAAGARKVLVDLVFTEAHARFVDHRYAEADQRLEIVILLDDRHKEAIHLAGNVAALTNRLDLASDLIGIAIGLDDTVAGYHANLGNVRSQQRRYVEALEALERALAIDPDSAQAHTNIGAVYHQVGAPAPALQHLRRAIALDPSLIKAHSNLGVVMKEMGWLDEAIASYDRALALDPDFALAHSNRLFAKLYADVPPAELLEDARAFGRRFADPLLRRRPFPNDRDPGRRLRVGFVSGDFREHAVNYFLEPALRHLDSAEIETVAFTTSAAEDAVTGRLKGVFARWRSICGLDDAAAADLIEAERIDVLVDLSGHTSGNRLLVFAHKPAPVQVSWIGYPGTTGIAAIDYRLTDAHSEPEGLGDDLSVERLWRLPRVGACYQPNPACPAPVDHPPFEDNGHVTFGCFNRFTKVSDAALEAWGDILRAVPDARLLLEIAGIGDADVLAEVQARLVRCGLPLDRLILEPRSPKNRYVLYNRVDLALDPFPYNGGTTSLDTLWMGVPFVALRGEHFVARMGHSILNNVGLPELVARTRTEYVALAAGLALDPDRLRALRRGLRDRMAASPHMDQALLASDLVAAFRGMWRRWLATSGVA